MKRNLLFFLCGAAAGAALASAAWSLSPRAAQRAAEPVPPALAAEPAVAPGPGGAEASAPKPAAEAPGASERIPAAAPGEAPAPEDFAPAEAPAEPAPPPASAEPRRRRPPRWENMTEEQREEMRRGFRRMHDERTQRMADTFAERNGLPEEEAETVLAISDAVSERAMERIQRWTDLLQLQGRSAIPKDQGARVMRDLFDDIVKGYAELDETFGESWRENDPDFDLGQMLSPEVWGSVFRLGGMGGPGGPRRPRGTDAPPPPPRGDGLPGTSPAPL